MAGRGGWKFDLGFAGFAALFVGLGLRLWAIQVRGHEEALKEQDAQAWSIEDRVPLRGSILDARGETLAISRYVPSVFADPKFVEDRAGAARLLAEALGLEAPALLEKLAVTSRRFIWVKRHCTPEQAAAVRALGLNGVGFVDEPKREYPRGLAMGQVIGYGDIDGRGLEGLEAQHEKDLAGLPGRELVLRDGRRDLIASSVKTIQEAQPGADLVLTVDARIQAAAEAALQRILEKHSPESAVCVVMDPRTGDILALAGVPDYDPNRPAGAKAEARRCRAATDFWEPGSTFKGIVMAGLLEKGLVKPTEVIDCEGGSWSYRGRAITDVHGYGGLSVEDVLVKSSNVGMAKMVTRMSAKDLEAWIRGFGFGKSTGSGIPGESPGTMPREKVWAAQTVVSCSFGYAVGATPIQVAAAYCAIANGGTAVSPRLVGGMRRDGEPAELSAKTAGKRLISAKTSAALVSMMIQVVERGTGKTSKLDGWLVAGKTGTTKLLGSDGKYAAGKYASSFVAFAPADDPKLLVLVLVKEPQGAYYGGTVAAPAAGEILKEGLILLEVKPDPEKVKKKREEWAKK
jgi:cell division protein FtsI (penicillin-binding protein 3)